MTKISGIFAALFVFALMAVVMAVQPTSTNGDAFDYGFGGKGDTISSRMGTDTIAGASDSSVLKSNFVPLSGWQYLLVTSDLKGTATDSVKLRVVVRCEDYNGNKLYEVDVDSLTDSVGTAIVLPFGSDLQGTQFDILYKAYTGNGGQVITNREFLARRRPTK